VQPSAKAHSGFDSASQGLRRAAAALAERAAEAAISGPYRRAAAKTALRCVGDSRSQASYAANASPTALPVRRSFGTSASSHTDGSIRRRAYCWRYSGQTIPLQSRTCTSPVPSYGGAYAG